MIAGGIRERKGGGMNSGDRSRSGGAGDSRLRWDRGRSCRVWRAAARTGPAQSLLGTVRERQGKKIKARLMDRLSGGTSMVTSGNDMDKKR
jgi:hypothetical protein